MSYFIEREHCPVCQSCEYRELYSCAFQDSSIRDYLEAFYTPQGGVEFQYLSGADFILNECCDCGLIYQRQIPNEFLLRKLYEKWIDPKKSFERYIKKQDTDYYFNYAYEVMMLLVYFDTMPSQLKFLDFGMGWGYWIRMAKAFGCDTYGVDLSIARAEHAQLHGTNLITWDKIPTCEFDFINAEQVFEHLSEPLMTLSHLRAALKPRGLFKISVPNGADIKRRLDILDWSAPKRSKNSLNPVSPLEHINCFNHQALVRMATTVGLELVRFPKSFHYFSGFLRSALDTTQSRDSSVDWTFAVAKGLLRTVLRPSHGSIFRQQDTCLFFRRVE